MISDPSGRWIGGPSRFVWRRIETNRRRLSGSAATGVRAPPSIAQSGDRSPLKRVDSKRGDSKQAVATQHTLRCARFSPAYCLLKTKGTGACFAREEGSRAPDPFVFGLSPEGVRRRGEPMWLLPMGPGVALPTVRPKR